MDQVDQHIAFGEELDRLIDRFADEFDITYEAVIGILQMKIFALCKDVHDEMEGDCED